MFSLFLMTRIAAIRRWPGFAGTTAISLASLLLCVGPVAALETVTWKNADSERTVSGKILSTARDGGILLLGPDGRIWTIQAAEVVRRATDEREFVPLTPAAAAEEILRELPDGFAVHSTAHYVIMYNTTKAYAQWCGALLERLYTGFYNYWTRLGLKLKPPELPLVVVVFSDADSYATFTKSELAGDARQIAAFYSLASNRVCLYDLTGVDSLRQASDQRSTVGQINAIMTRPAALPMVSTVIHEATHQLAYNSGMHQRYADIPLWVSEGLAVFFESPDLRSSKGWQTIGAVHHARLAQFREYLPTRPGESLKTLTADNQRFLQPKQSLAAYAEAWALNHYLLKQKPKEYAAYLATLGQKEPFLWDEPGIRHQEFTKHLGEFSAVEKGLLAYVSKLK
ncbi:MAG: DUF1570 domain-containing protein [Pirellulales bacterium]|nr:DUF1570 domain-containing protein [Pirellulales bacterium]